MEQAVKQLPPFSIHKLNQKLNAVKRAVTNYITADQEPGELPGLRRHEVANALITTCKHLKIMAANGTGKEKDAALLALINLDHWYVSRKSVSPQFKQTMVTARNGRTSTTRFRTLLFDGTKTESVPTTGADNRVTQALKAALRAARSAPRYQQNKPLAYKVEHILARRRHRRQWQLLKFITHAVVNAIPMIAKVNMLRFLGEHVLKPIGHALSSAGHWLVGSRTKTILTATGTAGVAVVATHNQSGWFKRKWHALSMSWQARWQRWTGQDLGLPTHVVIKKTKQTQPAPIQAHQSPVRQDPRKASLLAAKTRQTRHPQDRQYVEVGQPYCTSAAWQTANHGRRTSAHTSHKMP